MIWLVINIIFGITLIRLIPVNYYSFKFLINEHPYDTNLPIIYYANTLFTSLLLIIIFYFIYKDFILLII